MVGRVGTGVASRVLERSPQWGGRSGRACAHLSPRGEGGGVGWTEQPCTWSPLPGAPGEDDGLGWAVGVRAPSLRCSPFPPACGGVHGRVNAACHPQAAVGPLILGRQLLHAGKRWAVRFSFLQAWCLARSPALVPLRWL